MNRVAMLTILMLSVLTPDYVCAQIPAEQDNLSLVSEWDLLGPDGDMSGLPIGLKEDHWVEEIYVDEAALRRNGIRLEQIRIEHVRTSGVSRRSALRFLLSMHGLGFGHHPQVLSSLLRRQSPTHTGMTQARDRRVRCSSMVRSMPVATPCF